MRELAFEELSHVSGAAFDPEAMATEALQRIGGSILAATAAAFTAGLIGYTRGGDAMGVFGLSIIGQMVGAAGAAVIGGIGGAIGGLLVPFDYVYTHAIAALENAMSGGIK